MNKLFCSFSAAEHSGREPHFVSFYHREILTLSIMIMTLSIMLIDILRNDLYVFNAYFQSNFKCSNKNNYQTSG